MQIVCANRAGTLSVLLDEKSRYTAEELQGELRPSYVISQMSQLIPLLEQHFDLQPPPHAENVVIQQTATA